MRKKGEVRSTHFNSWFSHIGWMTSQTCRSSIFSKLLEFRKELGSQLAEYHFCVKTLYNCVNDFAACSLGMLQKDLMA